MALRQIAFALARYTDAEGHTKTGNRGEIHEIPDGEVERLEALGGLVAVDAELHRPGLLVPLVEKSSDEHILSYLISGNSNEIFTQATEYPSSLIEKLIIAERKGLNRDGLITDLETLVPAVPKRRGRPARAAVVEPEVEGEDGEPEVDELADFVATNTIAAVVERAKASPDLAEALLAAEQARGEKTRKGVVGDLEALITPED